MLVQMVARIRVRLATVAGGRAGRRSCDARNTGLAVDPVAPAGPGGAPRLGGGGDRVRKPTLLERACGLQKGFLRVQTDLPPVPRSRGHTAGAERTGLTDRRVKVKRAPGRPRSTVAVT